LVLLVKLVFAPALVVASTLAARRSGPRLAGMVSAFPAIVGPLLLVTALEHGNHATARAAAGTVLGLVALAAFAVGYATTAERRGRPASLLVAWSAASLATVAASLLARHLGLGATTLLTCVALLLAALVLRRLAASHRRAMPGKPGLLVRALITALLVAGLATAVSQLGARAGGLLAALPLLASLLAVFTHREAGAAAAIELLRGTLVGMAGFVAFCALVAAMIVPAGAPAAFGAATAAALIIQVGLDRLGVAYPRARKSAGRSGEAAASARFRPSASRSAA
jgi:hypothetical protein